MNRLWRSVFVAIIFSSIQLLAQSLQVVSGNGQVVTENFVSISPLTVRASDAAGRPTPDVAMTWAITQGQGTIVNFTNRTDANGIATANFLGPAISPGTSFQPATITAASAVGSATFAITTALGRTSSGGQAAPPLVQIIAPTGTLTGRAGSTIPAAVVVKVVAQSGFQSGQPVPNVGLRIAPADPLAPVLPGTCNGPAGTVLTDQTGTATCDLILTNVVGTAQFRAVVGEYQNTPLFSVTTTAGADCSYSISPLVQNVAALAGTGTVGVSAAAGCSWTASSNAVWLAITSGASGSGSGPVGYAVAANTTTSARTGTITIAGLNFTVTQAAGAGTGPAALSIATGSSLPGAVVGSAYTVTLAAAGGTAPYTWTNLSALPPGLALTAATGVISGVPTSSGLYTFGITATDATGTTASQTFTLNIAGTSTGGGNLSIGTAAFLNGSIDTAYQQTVTVSGGCNNPFSGGPVLSLFSGSLPPGLQLIGAAVIGTPTSAGTFPFALRLADACGASITRNFSITITGAPAASTLIAAPAALTFAVQTGSALRPPDQPVSLSSGTTPVAFTATPATASGGAWLAVSPTTGTTPATLTVSIVNFTALTPGSYSGFITIASNAITSPVIVPVTLNVLSAPAVSVSPNSLRFNLSNSGATFGRELLTVTSALPRVAFNVTALTFGGGNWLLVSPGNSETPSGITVSADAAGIPVGSYTGTVTISPVGNSAAAVTVPITLNVSGLLGPPPPVVTSVTNAASFAPGPIAPGELITLFGSNLGPVEIARAQASDGVLPRQVAGTQVLFDGVEAPLIYVSASQVSAVVPYTLYGRATTRLQVRVQNQVTASFELRLADSAPGIFTLDASGQGAILNQNSSVNSLQNGAEPGSVVSVFATGEGQTDRPGSEGRVVLATELARPLQNVSAQVDGFPAEVLYAGSAPGSPAGVLQVNLRIPAEARRRNGPAPIFIAIGGLTSQAGVTVAIKGE